MKKVIGKPRITDIEVCMNKGYCYDMPVIRYNRSDYTTTIRKMFVYNISDKQV